MTFLRLTRDVFRRELQRIRRYPLFLTMSVVLPVLSYLFFSAFFENGVPRDIPIAVLDKDRTDLSRRLARMVGDAPTPEIRYGITDMLEGERMMKEGKIEAILYIPENFEKDILSGASTTVTAFISGLNIAANGLLNKDIQTAVTTFSSGVQIQILMKQGMSQAQAYQQMMPIYFDRHVLFNPYVNYTYYLLPAFMPMMLLIFTLLTTILAIGTELKNATAGQWFAAAGGRAWPALLGKMLPYTLLLWLMLLFMNTIMYKWVGVPLRGSHGVMLLAGLLFVLAYQSIGVLIVTVLSNLRLALSIGGGYSVLAFTFSGLTFPLMAMDGWVRIFAYIFPFTYYMEIFVDQAMRGAPAIYSIKWLGILALIVVLPMLCLPRLRRVATDKKYWGRA